MTNYEAKYRKNLAELEEIDHTLKHMSLTPRQRIGLLTRKEKLDDAIEEYWETLSTSRAY